MFGWWGKPECPENKLCKLVRNRPKSVILLGSFCQTIYRLRHIVLIAILFFVCYHFTHLSITELYVSFWNGSFTHYNLPETLNAYCLYHFEMDHLPIKLYKNPQRIVFIILEWANYQLNDLQEPSTRIVFIILGIEIYLLKPSEPSTLIVFIILEWTIYQLKPIQNPQRVLSLLFWNGPFSHKSLPDPPTLIVFIILNWTIYPLLSLSSLNVPFTHKSLPESSTRIVLIILKWTINPLLPLSSWNGQFAHKSLPGPSMCSVFIIL